MGVSSSLRAFLPDQQGNLHAKTQAFAPSLAGFSALTFPSDTFTWKSAVDDIAGSQKYCAANLVRISTFLPYWPFKPLQLHEQQSP